MKILFLADEECPYLYDYYQPGKLKEYDLIISCGDLKPEYLTFLVTMSHAPLLYVHGNHDGIYKQKRPEGCFCLEDTVMNVEGLRILGLGGSRKYNGGDHQYSEGQMKRRIRKLRWQLWKHKGVDLVVTHAPVEGHGDGRDPAHQGFAAFKNLLDKYQPKYLVHGHVHMSYGHDIQRLDKYGETTLINASQRYVLDLPEYPVDGVIIM